MLITIGLGMMVISLILASSKKSKLVYPLTAFICFYGALINYLI